MHRLKLLLFGCVALAFVGCQDVAGSEGSCSGKCDGFDTGAVEQLMPRAPQVSGSIKFTRSGDDWFFEVIGAKGAIELASDPYASRDNALAGALSLEENGVLPERYLVEERAGSFVYVVEAGNGQALATSRPFATEIAAREAADRVRDRIADIVQYKVALQDGARFTLERAARGSGWEFELVDDDGETVLKSQIYSSRRDAITGIQSVRKNGKEAAAYRLIDSPPSYVLRAGNNREIAHSPTFGSAADAEAAMDSTRALLTSERVANPW